LALTVTGTLRERTKIHAVTTKESLPVAVVIGPANQHEGRKLIPVMESIRVKHGRGRPRKEEEAEGPLRGHKVQHAAQQVLPTWMRST
jgi:hypothetical protein